MFTLSCYHSSDGKKSYTLAELYKVINKQTIADEAKGNDDDDVDAGELWGRIAPDGNIYRLNALEAEHLFHRADLEDQVEKISYEKRDLIDPVLKAQGKEVSPEARCALLLDFLAKTPVQNADDEEEGAQQPSSFLPIREFLFLGGARRYWYLCGLRLPTQAIGFNRQLKNRFLGLVIGLIQMCAPLMIFIRNWLLPTNYLRAPGGIRQYITFAELTCLGDFTSFATSCLGTLFLLIVYEVSRGYVLTEIRNASMMRYLPADWLWKQVGTTCNQSAILFTCLAMPLIFWSELAPKDIVFDSLAMLFIYSLDDLAGGALDYLDLTDDAFRQVRSYVTVLLAQCPVDLSDIMNPDAKDLEHMWLIKVNSEGLLSSKTGKKCWTRLSENNMYSPRGSRHAPNERTGLLRTQKSFVGEVDDIDSPFKFPHFYYTKAPAVETVMLPGGRWHDQLGMYQWYSLYYIIVALEVIVPPIFLIVNDPCYS